MFASAQFSLWTHKIYSINACKVNEYSYKMVFSKL